MSGWYPVDSDEEEEEPRRVGYPHAAPQSQVMGGRLARAADTGGTQGWYPPVDATGEDSPVGDVSALLATETPAPQARTQYESETAQQYSLDGQPQPARRVSWSGQLLGAGGSRGSMAVGDDGATVGAGESVPQMRLRGLHPTPNAGRRGRPEGIAAPEGESVPKLTPLPIRGMGAVRMDPPSRAEPKSELRGDDPPPSKGLEKKQRIDYQAHPELCLSAEEQIDKVRTDAVTALVNAMPWRLTALGRPDDEGPGGFVRTEDERYRAVVRALYAKGAARNKSTASMLHKMAAFLSEQRAVPVSSDKIFPISVGFMEAAKQRFENTVGSKTAAKSMHEDINWLRRMGLPVPSEEEVETSLARRAVRRPASGSGKSAAPNARRPIGPKMLCDIEWYSIHGRHRDDEEAMAFFAEHGTHMPPPKTVDGDIMPAHAYALAQWSQLAACDRGVGIWASKWDPPMNDNTAKYTACIDKDSRLSVPRVVPNGGFECERHPLIVEYSRVMEGQPLTPFFAYAKGESMLAAKSIRWVGPTEGPRLPFAPVAARPTAMGALVSTRSHVTGVPTETLVALKMSGTHTDRHVAPEIAAQLNWPEDEIAVLGDWSEPSDESETEGKKRKKKKPNFALACNSVTYHLKATEDQTMASRQRLTDAARAFIARAGGYEALYSDTLWSDIIPRKCPAPEFVQFYGASWSETGTDAIGEAAKTLTDALDRLEGSDRRRSARVRGTPPSKEVGGAK